MLSTYLAAYPWLAPSLAVAVVLVGPVVAWALVGRRRAATILAMLAVVGVGLVTLWPSGIDRPRGCDVGWHVELLAPEPLANVVLLAPVSVLLAVAMRRPILAALVGAAFAAGIELAQALVPAIGRSCTLDDWVANATGAALGAILGGIGLGLARWQRGRGGARHMRGRVDRASRGDVSARAPRRLGPRRSIRDDESIVRRQR